MKFASADPEIPRKPNRQFAALRVTALPVIVFLSVFGKSRGSSGFSTFLYQHFEAQWLPAIFRAQ
jgi:hypothetical protein